jgi:probable H4MPT-linked C1 transfer pathway protein
MSATAVMGWDLGGAHLKAAVREPDGGLRVFLEPCPLWQGLAELTRAMDRILERSGDVGRHVVTMTGELVDLFPDRASGVTALVTAMRDHLPPEAALSFYARGGACLAPEAALAHPRQVASANWRAGAEAVAAAVPEALVVDVGSTTSDLIPVRDGAVRADGESDATRLAAGELVYTGAVRTPVMAVGGPVPVAGHWVPLAAEWFATMADVHRLRGVLPPGADLGPTADGAPADIPGSARRLARMVGHDADNDDPAPWRRVADYLADRQVRSLADAAFQVESRTPMGPDAPVVGAGVGRFVAADLARRLDRPYRDFLELVPAGRHAGPPDPADCAPAVALAVLAEGGRR